MGKLHFWPGPERFIRTPGARLVCGVRVPSGAPTTTNAPEAATCKACRGWLAAERLAGRRVPPGPWDRFALASAQFLDLHAPAAPPRPPPYRNPRLAPEGRRPAGPVAALAERTAARAEAERSAGRLDVFAALRSVAAELADLDRELRGGVW